jgi:hypothetical protein
MFWRNSERKEELSLKQYGVHRMLTIDNGLDSLATKHTKKLIFNALHE